MWIQATQRQKVTVDDRRAVMAMARGFKPTVSESREAFIRNALKARLNWPSKGQLPKSILDAAREMAQHFLKLDRETRAANEAVRAAKVASKTAEEIAFPGVAGEVLVATPEEIAFADAEVAKMEAAEQK